MELLPPWSLRWKHGKAGQRDNQDAAPNQYEVRVIVSKFVIIVVLGLGFGLGKLTVGNDCSSRGTFVTFGETYKCEVVR